ncbi:PREDICTED: serpin-ZX-like [Tarenaya hassleriana]|uniref:serpin-ZX-like n=1 Tax=Tarenaya hassleriana TaxID=28532 RepID=UPI00053C2D7B|nr:PREDICTED: serpin-ZX-like [Tarenaya hassleriana]
MDVRESIANQNNVALTLSSHVISSIAGDSNFVFSPASINVVLGIIAAGSGGSTKDQILSFLRASSSDHLNAFFSEIASVVFADGSPNGGPKISAATGAWIDKSLAFKPSFKDLLEGSYKATSNQTDFQTKAIEAAGEVNSWAEKQTNGLIKELLPSGSVDSMTKLIFANALYFKGAWHEKFDSLVTKDDDFHLIDGTSVRVPFMTSTKKQYISAYDRFKVLGLPYQQGEDRRQFSMYFYLPEEKNGLPALLEKISSTSGFIDSHIPYQQAKVGEFRIPKFKFSFGFKASEALKGLGLTAPFTGEDGLTEMVDSPSMGKNLNVSSIFHKSFIEVNEEGTEAAAASAGVIKLRGLLVEEKIDFVADHPFLFLVRENITGVVLFIGQVLHPLQN